jgi:hypothetical protein
MVWRQVQTVEALNASPVVQSHQDATVITTAAQESVSSTTRAQSELTVIDTPGTLRSHPRCKAVALVPDKATHSTVASEPVQQIPDASLSM